MNVLNVLKEVKNEKKVLEEKEEKKVLEEKEEKNFIPYKLFYVKQNRKFFSESGSGIEKVYAFKSISGINVLRFKEYKDIYSMIQSFKNDNNIYKILDRVMKGDYSALDKNQGFYEDFEKVPKNINDLNDYYNNLESQFNSSDPKFKSYFANNYKNMIHCMQDGSFDTKVNDYLSKNHPEILKRQKAEQDSKINFVKNIVKEEIENAKKIDK